MNCSCTSGNCFLYFEELQYYDIIFFQLVFPILFLKIYKSVYHTNNLIGSFIPLEMDPFIVR